MVVVQLKQLVEVEGTLAILNFSCSDSFPYHPSSALRQNRKHAEVLDSAM